MPCSDRQGVRALHPVGITTSRYSAFYSPEQAEKQWLLVDMAYAASYGFIQTRLPTPGVSLPEAAIGERLERVAAQGRIEMRRAKGTRELDPMRDLPPLARAHYYERLLPFPAKP